MIFLVLLGVGLLALPAFAQQHYIYYKISAGTGFVINRDGDTVTNAHVVQACQSVSVLTDGAEHPADIVASDAKQDLAVLKVDGYRGRNVAPLRWKLNDLKIGDPVYVIGYPGQEGVAGHEQIKKTVITSLKGPRDEPHWIQLDSVAAHGNSGGPVLDTSGNVIAVISGMALTYAVDPNGVVSTQAVAQKDFAITLAALQNFLHEHNISFYESASDQVGTGDRILDSDAHDFIVPIRCIQGSEQR